MSEPIKPFAWLVIDKEDGCEYGNMHPDYGRDCCHEHIKDAQETGIPHARRWVVREVFSREQVEQATAELRAERDAMRAIVQSVSTRVPHILAGGHQCACSWCSDIRAARAALKEVK